MYRITDMDIQMIVKLCRLRGDSSAWLTWVLYPGSLQIDISACSEFSRFLIPTRIPVNGLSIRSRMIHNTFTTCKTDTYLERGRQILFAIFINI